MRLKVQGGTVHHGEPSLCVTCRWATVVIGTSLRHRIVECGQLTSGHNLITFHVTCCSGYSDRRLPSLREMEEIAWVLRTDPKRKQIGFVRASELARKDRFVLPDDEPF